MKKIKLKIHRIYDTPEVEGYLYEDKDRWLFVHRNLPYNSYWTVTEPTTGYYIESGFRTRKEAIVEASKYIDQALKKSINSWGNIIKKYPTLNKNFL